MSKPGDGLRFATAGGTFNEIVALRPIQDHIIHDPLDGTQLVKAREDEFFGHGLFPGIGIAAALCLYVNKSFNQKQNSILRPNVLPHRRH